MKPFDFISDEVFIHKTDITSRLSDQMIYSRYCDRFNINKKIRSPFRKDDHPSFNFYIGSGRIFWKDHGSNEGGDVFSVVQKHLKANGYGNYSYPKVLEKINSDFCLGLGNTFTRGNFLVQNDVSKSNFKSVEKTVIKVIKKPFTMAELQYWNAYGIGLPYLKMYHVGSAEIVFCDNQVSHIFSSESPVFYFHYPKTDHLKIYRPFAKTRKKKWLSNVYSSDDVQGWEQCAFGRRSIKLLILTKAMKEVMFFRTFGIDAIAIQGEGHYYKDETIAYLKEHSDKIICFYDRDKTGMKAAKLLWRKHGIIPFFMNKKYQSKNITDLWIKDPKSVYSILKQLIKL